MILFEINYIVQEYIYQDIIFFKHVNYLFNFILAKEGIEFFKEFEATIRLIEDLYFVKTCSNEFDFSSKFFEK